MSSLFRKSISVTVCAVCLGSIGSARAATVSSGPMNSRAVGVIPQGNLIIIGTNVISPTPQPVQPLIGVPGASGLDQQNRGLGIGQQGTGTTLGQQGSTLTAPPVLPPPAPVVTPQGVQPAITPQDVAPVIPPQTVPPVVPPQGRGLGIGQQGSGTGIGQQGNTLIGPQGNGPVPGQQGTTPVPPPAPATGNPAVPNTTGTTPNGSAQATGLIVPNSRAAVVLGQQSGSLLNPQGALILIGPQTSSGGTVSAPQTGAAALPQTRNATGSRSAVSTSAGATGRR